MLEGQHVRLSGAALETLAIVAYKQPISRADLRDPGRQRRVDTDDAHPARLRRGERARSGSRARRCSTARPRCSSNGSASTRSRDLPPLGDFVPDASVVDALERGLRLSDDPTGGSRTRLVPSSEPTPTTESRAGAGAEGPCPRRARVAPRVRGVDRCRAGDRRRRGRGARRSGRRDDATSRARRCPGRDVAPTSSTTS